MQKTIEVVYEKGVFKPLERVDFGEGEKVVISIETEKKKTEKLKSPYGNTMTSCLGTLLLHWKNCGLIQERDSKGWA